MTTEVFPNAPDPDPCRELSCNMQDSPVSACRKRGCGFEWARTARIDRQRREEQDARERENV